MILWKHFRFHGKAIGSIEIKAAKMWFATSFVWLWETLEVWWVYF